MTSVTAYVLTCLADLLNWCRWYEQWIYFVKVYFGEAFPASLDMFRQGQETGENELFNRTMISEILSALGQY